MTKTISQNACVKFSIMIVAALVLIEGGLASTSWRDRDLSTSWRDRDLSTSWRNRNLANDRDLSMSWRDRNLANDRDLSTSWRDRNLSPIYDSRNLELNADDSRPALRDRNLSDERADRNRRILI